MFVVQQDFHAANRSTWFAVVFIIALGAVALLFNSRDADAIAGAFDRLALVQALGVIVLWWPQWVGFEFRKAIFWGATIVVVLFLFLMLWAYA
jgi:hypothetical protein